MTLEFFLYSRQGCEPCRKMLHQLRQAAAGRDIRCHVIDVDEDEELRVRFGNRVPVLECRGSIVCESKFDPGAVSRILDEHAAL